eukprot:scaffold34634_cov171-Amphora_coffeaeformis.AAC.14
MRVTQKFLLILLLPVVVWASTSRQQDPWSSATMRLTKSTTRGLFQRGGGMGDFRLRPKKAANLDKKKEDADPVGTASIPSEVFNLIKLIVGAGVLGLPGGIAAFGDHPSALVPSFVLFCFIGALAGYGFSLIGTVCAATRARSYRQAWRQSVGESSSWIPATACLLVTCCSVLTNSMIQADTIPSILKAFTGITISRTTGLLGVTVAVLLPLCLMRELKSLAPFSLIGIFGMIYTAAAMAFRCLRGSYLGGSPLLADLAENLQPSFGNSGWSSVFSPNAAILVAMLSSSFMAHYNAPRMYWELRDNTLPRFNTVVRASFAGAVALMSSVALAGFGTFGGASASMILNNYAVSDKLMSLSRAAVAVSLLFTFPLAFLGVREGVMDLLLIPSETRKKISDPLTVVLLTIITSIAMVLKDIRLILSFGGATWGNFVIYGFPALMVVQGAKRYPQLKPHVRTAALNGILGIVLAVVGTTRAIQSIKR